MSAENDNDTARDVVDDVDDEFMARSVPILRALLKARFQTPKRERRVQLREESSDRETVDELTRARARELLSKHTRSR